MRSKRNKQIEMFKKRNVRMGLYRIENISGNNEKLNHMLIKIPNKHLHKLPNKGGFIMCDVDGLREYVIYYSKSIERKYGCFLRIKNKDNDHALAITVIPNLVDNKFEYKFIEHKDFEIEAVNFSYEK